MEILLHNCIFQKEAIHAQNMDTDERIVRKELVKVWTKVMEKYAKPGARIPSIDNVRNELLRVGVDAAVEAVCDEHWFLFPWMVRGEIEQKVGRELERFNLQDLMDEVRMAQGDPGMLPYLRDKIKRYVLEPQLFF